MIGLDRMAIFTIAFSVACAVAYAICVVVNLPLLTYHPVIGKLDILWTPEQRGPAMYWYGWMLTSSLAGLALASIATGTPERWVQCTVLFGCLAAVTYLIVSTVALFVYDQATVELPWLQSRWLSAGVSVALALAVGWLLPGRWREQLWPGWAWAVPLGTLIVLGYYLVPYFTH